MWGLPLVDDVSVQSAEGFDEPYATYRDALCSRKPHRRAVQTAEILKMHRRRLREDLPRILWCWSNSYF